MVNLFVGPVHDTWRRFRMMVAVIVGLLVWNVLVISAFAAAEVETGNGMELREAFSAMSTLQIYGTLGITVAFEEMLRLGPLAFCLFVARWAKSTDRVRATVALAITAAGSVAFALLHVGNGLTVPFVLFSQGVGGTAFTVLFLRFGGLAGSFVGPFAWAWATHFLFDIAVLTPALLAGAFAQ